MKSGFLFLGALSALTGVAMGAFGAHALKATLSPEMLTIYQTGVTYQMWHALGLIGIALILQHAPESRLLNWAGGGVAVGGRRWAGAGRGRRSLSEWRRPPRGSI